MNDWISINDRKPDGKATIEVKVLAEYRAVYNPQAPEPYQWVIVRDKLDEKITHWRYEK